MTLPIVLSVLGIGKLKDVQPTDLLTREISSPKSPAATGFDVSGMELVNVYLYYLSENATALVNLGGMVFTSGVLEKVNYPYFFPILLFINVLHPPVINIADDFIEQFERALGLSFQYARSNRKNIPKREARRFVLKVHQKSFRVSLSQLFKTAIDSRARKPWDFSWTAFRPRHRCASRRPRHLLSSIWSNYQISKYKGCT